jgi:hypothetical protein
MTDSTGELGGRTIRRRNPAAGFAVLLAIGISITSMPGAEADVDIAVGDFWRYGFEGTSDNLTIAGELTFEVASATEGSYMLSIDGSGDVSGTLDDLSVGGEVAFRGTMERLRSNFSQVESTVVIDMSLTSGGFSFTAAIGVIEQYRPSVDDYIGDDNPTQGVKVNSSCEVRTETWFNILGFNETESSIDNVTATLEVLEENVTVVVPAGTFKCYKVGIEIDSGDDVSTEFVYYSDEVGYYVKMDGSDLMAGGISSLELVDYSYGAADDGGILSLLVDNWWVLLVIAAVVVIVVVMAAATRPKPPAPVTVPPPPQSLPPRTQ